MANSEAAQLGPAALVLSATIARRYYLDGATKSDIAAELNLSRFKVARLLDDARASGLVRIELDYHGEVQLDLSVRLRSAFGLRHCVVVESPEDDATVLLQHLGRAAAGLLNELVTPDDVLGLAWARSSMAMRNALRRLAPCPVVQLSGALSRPDVDESSIELVRDVARISNGPAFFFYAPMIVPDAATAQALKTQPEVARAFKHFTSLTKAVVGVGAWHKNQSTVADAVSDRERNEMHKAGVRAEVCGVQVDSNGMPIVTSLSQRLIAIDAAALQGVPEVIGIVYGAEKVDAVRAVVRGGIVTSLVTHTAMAAALLERV